MRSVIRGGRPVESGGQPVSFANYGHAKEFLIKRLGEYCSYCERTGDLHVEHIVPKSKSPDLETEWSNFLLGCVNCNSRKSNDNDSRDGYLWPDNDNTFNAFEYRSGGRVSVGDNLRKDNHKKALALFDLVGLGAKESRTDKRRHKRRWAWDQAVEVRDKLVGKDDSQRRLAVMVAAGTGFFSVWMAVFQDDADMRRRLVDAFPGTRDDSPPIRGGNPP